MNRNEMLRKLFAGFRAGDEQFKSVAREIIKEQRALNNIALADDLEKILNSKNNKKGE
jgi:hypothetical protein